MTTQRQTQRQTRSRTRSQTRILESLKQLDRSVSAQDLYAELRQHEKSMGLATVYRALDALKKEGAVQVRTLTTGESLYSLIQEDRHHLTCLQCCETIELDSCPVHALEQQFSEQYQFKMNYHVLEFFGICHRCSLASGT
jgi:Fur family transcriptional regulator, ferric uptake regulator